MKKFAVCTESRGHRFDVVVEAENLSEAVKLVREKHCGPRMVEVTPSPTWAEPVPEGQDDIDECGELTYEIHAFCEDCGSTLFQKKTPEQGEWKWTYASGDDGCHTTICYPCAVKRKEAGNYCAFYSHYYRDDHHHGCDSCPAGGCSKAQERYYKNVQAQLKDAAIYYQQQSNKEFAEFLEHNELGLAYEILAEIAEKGKGAHHIQLQAAKMLMDEGWW